MGEHRGRRIAGWIALALAGLAVAVALSVAASNLSTQPIGLSGEPLRAGDKLAPPVTAPARPTMTTTTKRTKPRRPSTTQPTQAVPTQTATSRQTTPTTTTQSGDDHGHRHGGHGSDD